MQKKSILYLFLASIFLVSCGNHFTLQKRHYRKGFYFGRTHSNSHKIVAKEKNNINELKEITPIEKQLSKDIQTNIPESHIFNEIKNDSANQKQTKKNYLENHLPVKQIQDKISSSKKIVNHVLNNFNKLQKKSGSGIILDIFLIIIGVLAGIVFFYLGIIIIAFGSGASGAEGLAAFFIILAIVCVALPIAKLISDL